MKLHILFGQRKCDYEGQYGPEALLCWDEFCVDENPDGWEQAVAAEEARAKEDGFVATRVIEISVDGDKIAKLLNQTPVVAGTIVEAP